MPNVSNFGTQTDNAVVQGTVTDRAMVIPDIPPQGLMSVGPRVTPNFVKPSLWSALTTYHFFDAVHDAAGASYVAIKPEVPAGTELTDEGYWFLWADPNSQFADLSELVKTFNGRITQNTADISANTANIEKNASDISSINKKVAPFVTPEQFGAKGDGVTDDTEAFKAAIDSGKAIILTAGKTYKIATIELTKNVSMYGSGNAPWIVEEHADTATSPAIICNSDYAFTSFYDANREMQTVFYGIMFKECGLKDFYNATIENCIFFKSNIALNNIGATLVTNCTMANANVGIKTIVDSFFTNSQINNCKTAIDLTNSGDSIISGNKIQWCGLGIDLVNGVFINIANNIFDRMTTYAINIQRSQGCTIQGNIFERSLEAHIAGKLTVPIINNSFLQKRKNDDDTSDYVPDSPFDVEETSNFTLLSNNMFEVKTGCKLNKQTITVLSRPNIENLIINRINYSPYTLDKDATVTNHEFSINTNDLFGLNGYDFHIESIYCYNSNTYQMIRAEVQPYDFLTSSITVKTPSFESGNIHYEAKIAITNPWKIVVPAS